MIQFRTICWFAVLVILLNAHPASAEELIGNPPSPVQLGGRTLFNIQAGAKAFSAQSRAKAATDRLREVAQDYSISPDTVTTTDLDFATLISAGDKVVMSVFDADAAEAGQGREELARELAEKMRQAIRDYRGERSARVIAMGLIYTLLATLVLIGLFILLRRGIQALEQAVRDRLPIRSVQIGSFEFFNAERIKGLILMVVRIFRFGLLLTLIYAYLHLGLSFFPWTRNIARRLLDYVFDALSTMGIGLLDQLPGLTFLVVLYFVTRYVLKTLRLFFEQVRLGRVRIGEIDADVAEPTYKLIRLLLIAFAVVVAYPYIPGSESPAFKGVSIFVGVIFSLGSTSAIGNITAGLSLVYMRAFREGDVVKIGDAQGVVLQRKVLTTRLKTFKNEEVSIPNSSILAAQVTNYSHQAARDGLIVHTTVTIGYDAPWRQVHELLLAAADASEHILKSPPPFVLQTALNDFYVSYELNGFTRRPDIMPAVYSELHRNIQDKFNEAGVEIMSPHYAQLRDGNTSTIPGQYLPPGYVPSAIRIVSAKKPEKTP